MLFKKGETLRFVGTGYGARPGALAVVREDQRIGDRYVEVEWLDDAQGQGDGGYFPENFEPATNAPAPTPRRRK